MTTLALKITLAVTAALMWMPAMDGVDVDRSTSANSFGAAIAVAPDVVFIAEPDHAKYPGTIYVQRRTDDGRWIKAGTLTQGAGAPHDAFGAALAAEGDRLLVGIPTSDGGRGRALVIRRTEDGAWSDTVSLVPADTALVGFGATVALEGRWALVGAPVTENGRGAVVVFRETTEGWREHDTLESPAREDGALFGFALDLDGEIAYASAPAEANRSGAVYAFSYDAVADAWRAGRRLEATAVVSNTMLGVSLEADDGLLAVGAPFAGWLIGRVHLFRHDSASATTTEVGTVIPQDGDRGAQFGLSLGLRLDTLWVGAPGTAEATGAVYTFARDADGMWAEVGKLVADGGEPGDAFGAVVEPGRTVVAVGMPGDDYRYGAAALFEPTDSGWTQVTRAVSTPDPLPLVTGDRVACQGGAAGIFPCDVIDLVAFLPLEELGVRRGIELNDLWGWTDSVTGRDYALVGRTNGTAFVDLTDPAHPRYVGELPAPVGTTPSAWRDIKVYAKHAFVVADNAGPHGVQVFDLTQLRTVDDPPQTFTATARYDRIFSAHNIAINEATGFAYVLGASGGGETCGGGLHMIDVRDPEQPTFAGCFARAGIGRNRQGYTHDAQCVVYRGPDSTYVGHEVCFGANETAVSITDVTDKSNPISLGLAEYPNIRYAHQGWLTEDHRFFFLGDELDEIDGFAPTTRTLIFDVSDLDDPTLATEHLADTPASDHNMYIRGTLAYQTHYQAGLRVLDITDPTNPVQIASFDTFPFVEDVPAMDGAFSNYPFFDSDVIVVTGRREGLFVVRLGGGPVIP